ncbi:MAG: hypothetical protein ACK56I_34835, partial [bacterium]
VTVIAIDDQLITAFRRREHVSSTCSPQARRCGAIQPVERGEIGHVVAGEAEVVIARAGEIDGFDGVESRGSDAVEGGWVGHLRQVES